MKITKDAIELSDIIFNEIISRADTDKHIDDVLLEFQMDQIRIILESVAYTKKRLDQFYKEKKK